MQVRRQTHGLLITTPAKLNLFLEVLAKRSDGYHEIETLMCPISLYDSLWFQGESGTSITLHIECLPNVADSNLVPQGSENLVLRALELLRAKSGCRQGATLRLLKRIPVAAGLAGGSSDAAAALVAGNLGWNLGFSVDELSSLAAELGSDVAFFLFGRSALCHGRGEKISLLSPWGQLHFVVVRPPMGLSTAEVYQNCQAAANARSVRNLLDALIEGDLAKVGVQLHNRLELPARGLTFWIDRLKQEFSKLDLPGHKMSGSGTSYFGLCRNAKHAQHLAGRLRGRGLGRVFVVTTCREEIAI